MRGKLIRSLALAAAVLLWTHSAIARPEENKKAESEPFKPLTVDEVQKRLTAPDVHVYDGNNDDVYREGHIPGAVHLFSKDIKEGALPSDKDSTLIFYCHNER
jgi:rhodanese-like protein